MNSLNPRMVKTNVKDFKILTKNRVPLGHQMDAMRALKTWKEDEKTRKAWISQKRKSFTAALREFRDLYEAKEYYMAFGKHDDSIEVFYRT
ncbi:hypothetical protein [Marinobacter sp.]|uniref:hypothetical protein n=1 Tax=Marinobacter sp. TaxID=50741 RepID=UPI003562CEFC